MDDREFRKIVEEEWDGVPAPHKERIRNVALLVEDEPSDDVRKQEGLRGEETLLGLYQGIPLSERGQGYGIGPTLPDTITVYRLPTLREAEDLTEEAPEIAFSEHVRQVVRDTLWHEIGHYFGYDEGSIAHREAEGTNEYKEH